MEDGSWLRVDQWWAERLGVPVSELWPEGVTVSTRSGLDDFDGIAVWRRDASAHVLLPGWADAKLADQLRVRDPAELLAPGFWRGLGPVAGRKARGPVVHSYTDEEVSAPRSVEEIDPASIADWEDAVSPKKWRASGFAGNVRHAFAIRSGDAIAAASNLTKFMGGSSNVGVLTHPAYRGRGFATRVTRAATAYAVEHEGIARFRYDADHARSRSVARALTFEDYCEQLVIE
jgi:RimJ/RimL family protein N-acetyltransferase